MKKKDRTGEKSVMRNGQTAEIIRYGGALDIDVRFEDGTVREHMPYQMFRDKKIPNPNLKHKDPRIEEAEKKYVGQKKITKSGLKAVITEYRTNEDITVNFSNGQSIRTSVKTFAGESFDCPVGLRRLGETETKDGITKTIVGYRSIYDIDIRYGNGFVLEHTTYTMFKSADIPVQAHIGEKATASNGQEMELVNAYTYHDVNIRFSDGTLIEHKAYCDFKEGRIGNPNAASVTSRRRSKYEGMKKVSNQGVEMTLAEYRDFKHCLVCFDDGYKTTVPCSAFLSGYVNDPLAERKRKYKKGYSFIPTCGMKAVVKDYLPSSGYLIEFEDGETVPIKDSSAISAKNVGHPALKAAGVSHYKGYICRRAYKENGNVYYQCIDEKTGKKSLMTPHELIAAAGEREINAREDRQKAYR